MGTYEVNPDGFPKVLRPTEEGSHRLEKD